MYRKRLKNIYELLEAGSNRKVIQEVDKLLSNNTVITGKKPVTNHEVSLPGYDEQTTFIIAKSLKCLALVRVGRKVEGEKMIEELLETKTMDENALNILMQYCKETQQFSKIVTFYENAVEKFQQNKNFLGTQEHEDILISLFNVYVRNRDFIKQQQIALKLYKQTNKIMFAYWNAASCVLLSKSNSINDQQKDMYLQLAEKILQKIYDEKKMEFNGEFLLYLNILETRKKYDYALEILKNFDQEKHLAKIGQPNFKFIKIIFYYKNLKNWQLLKEECENYFLEPLESNLDDWQAYIEYFNSIIELFAQNQNKLIFDDVLLFLEQLVHKVENSQIDSKKQGPYLARVEFIKYLLNLDQENNDSYLEKLKKFLFDLINIFSCKPGFFYDLTRFNDLIQKHNLIEYVISLLQTEYENNSPFKSVKSIYTCLSYWQLHRYFGKQASMSNQELNDLANNLEKYYLKGLEFGKDLLPTAFQYSDDFLILSLHIRYELIRKNFKPDENNIFNLVSSIRYALSLSPSNFQLKLILLNLYSQLGAYDLIKKIYDSMEIKNIQHYSTANLLLFNNFRLSSFETSMQTLNSMDNFFSSGFFDTASFMANCYKYGTFLKAFEINSFIDSTKLSLNLNICLTNNMCNNFIIDQVNLKETEENYDFTNNFKLLKEKIDDYLRVISNCSSSLDQNGLLSTENEKKLIDHSDNEVLYNWNPINDNIIIKSNYDSLIENEKKLLKLRILIIRLTHSSILTFIENVKDENLSKYINELLNFDYSYKPIANSDLKIFNLKSNYLKKFSDLNLNQFVCLIVSLIKDLSNEHEFLELEQNNNQINLIKYKQELEKLCENMKLIFSNLNLKIENIDEAIESSSVFLEFFSYIILLYTICLSNNFFKPIWIEKCKKAKKKKGAYLKYCQSVDLIFEIYEQIAMIISYFINQLNTLQESLEKSDQFTKFQPSFINDDSFSTDLSDILNSYKKSFEECKKILNSKLKFLFKFSSNSINKDLTI